MTMLPSSMGADPENATNSLEWFDDPQVSEAVALEYTDRRKELIDLLTHGRVDAEFTEIMNALHRMIDATDAVMQRIVFEHVMTAESMRELYAEYKYRADVPPPTCERIMENGEA